MIEGLSHITFIVEDLDRMADLLTRVFDAEEIYSNGAETFSISREKFFLIGGQWIAVMDGEALPNGTYNHIAFKIAEADLPLYRERISALGLDPRESRPHMSGEGSSLYFYDYDNHLFELHTGTLAERLVRYAQGRGAAA